MLLSGQVFLKNGLLFISTSDLTGAYISFLQQELVAVASQVLHFAGSNTPSVTNENFVESYAN